MTPDPLLRIAEEMESIASLAKSLGGEHARNGATYEMLAARIRSFWTPERRAFYEAAERLGMYCDTSGSFGDIPNQGGPGFHKAWLKLEMTLVERDPAHGNPHAGEPR